MSSFVIIFKMPSRNKLCCVVGCRNREGRRYVIAAEKNCRKVWLQRIGNPKLFELSDSQIKNERICQLHFHGDCIDNNSGKLKKGSLPSINLAGYTEEHNEISVTPKKNFQEKKIKDVTELGPSTSFGRSPKRHVTAPIRTYSNSKRRRLECNESASSVSENLAGNSPNSRKTFQLLSEGNKRRTIKRNNRGRKAKLARELLRKVKNRKNPHSYKFLNNINSLNKTTLNFLECQIKNQVLEPRGRRFTLDDKIFALSTLRQCRKGYKFLSKFFSLPSRQTLNRLLSNLDFQCGLNEFIFQNLEKAVGKLKPLDKICILMFDEISLCPGLTYNKKNDVIEGLVDFGNGNRQAVFADHALVFMLKGVHRKWKQPICFFFCEGTTSSINLVRILKEIVVRVRNCGLEIIASVSDQGGSNRGAINKLLKETNEYCLRRNIENRHQGYLINGIEIIHLYDCPHLMKGIRNSMLSKNIIFKQNEQKEASWSHIIELYNKDKDMGLFSQCSKLTDEHVIPHKIKKMKVKNCTQVFSRSVAVALKTRAEISNDLPQNSPYYISPAASDTADLLMFFDKLFDSVNASFFIPPAGKQLRGMVTSNSPHINTWKSSIPVLNSMFFKSSSSSKKIPSITNFIFTLHGFLYLWNKLKSRGFKHMSTRCFNQDPLENFFSLVRSHGVRNVNPTCSSFTSSFKSLVLNNFMSPHSPNANCEEDESCGALDDLKEFVNSGSRTDEIISNTIPPIYPEMKPKIFDRKLDFSTAYVAGYIGRKLCLKLNCDACANILKSSVISKKNLLITKRTYSNCSMMYPSEFYLHIFHQLISQIVTILPSVINSFKISEQLADRIDIPDIQKIFCKSHESYSKFFIQKTIIFFIFFYVKKINKILKGTDLRHKNFDVVCNLAFQKYLKRKKT